MRPFLCSVVIGTILFTTSLAALLPTAHAKSLSKQAKVAIEAAQDALDEKSMLTPKDNEVCFSPDERCGIKFKKFILSAKESLDIAIFDISNKDLTDAIVAQSKKIKVRVLLDKMQSREKHGKLQAFKEAKVNYRFGKQKGIMHHKFTLVDHKKLQTGSFNYTYRGAKANQENQVYLSTPSIVERFEKQFDHMWRNAKLK